MVRWRIFSTRRRVLISSASSGFITAAILWTSVHGAMMQRVFLAGIWVDGPTKVMYRLTVKTNLTNLPGIYQERWEIISGTHRFSLINIVVAVVAVVVLACKCTWGSVGKSEHDKTEKRDSEISKVRLLGDLISCMTPGDVYVINRSDTGSSMNK